MIKVSHKAIEIGEVSSAYEGCMASHDGYTETSSYYVATTDITAIRLHISNRTGTTAVIWRKKEEDNGEHSY